MDGFKGFPDAINAAFPETTVQTCIVHLVRCRGFRGPLQLPERLRMEGSQEYRQGPEADLSGHG
jgi:hypothetical protein